MRVIEHVAISKGVIMNKTNKKTRFGLTDVIIILFVLSAVGAAVWLFAVGPLFDGGEDIMLSYEVRITNVRSELASHIKLSDRVYDGVYGEAIGTVEDIRIEPYTEEVIDKSTGEPVNASKDGYCNIYIKINAAAKQKDGVCFVADTEIRVGEPVYVKLPDFVGAGYCTAFTVIGEES